MCAYGGGCCISFIIAATQSQTSLVCERPAVSRKPLLPEDRLDDIIKAFLTHLFTLRL